MTMKRRILGALGKAELLEAGKRCELEVSARMTVDELRDALAGSKKAKIEDVVTDDLGRGTLKEICEVIGVDASGREIAALIGRILEAAQDGNGAAVKAKPAEQKSAANGAEKKTSKSRGKQATEGAVPEAAPQPWLPFPQLDPPAERKRSTVPPRVFGSPGAGDAGREFDLTLEVQPRRPRLAWQGMSRKEVAVAVPTQVVEIVRPGRAVVRGEELNIEARQVTARDVTSVPPNRLIWTNDNLVALQTLIDEKDPATRDYRYRGKVDLVYIDPPFMVNNDFRADNSIDIELDDEAGVQAKKEPSLVEILAYKDTWRQGLDSFLTMLRRRLELLKQLLVPWIGDS